jgi:hypothetical protein
VGGVIGDVDVNMYSDIKDDEEKEDQDYILFTWRFKIGAKRVCPL